MKKTKFYFLTCFLSLGTFVGAQAQTLTEIYSGSKLPTEEGWQEWRLDSSVRPEAGEAVGELKEGAVRIWAADGEYTQLGYYKVNPALNPETGYTVEIKAKVTDASEYGAFVVQGYTPDGKGFRLGIYKTYLAASTNPVAPIIVLKDGLDNSDAFHTYRLAVTKTAVNVYRDGTPVGTFPVITYYGDNLITNGGFEDFNGKSENENTDEVDRAKFIGNGWSVSGGRWERSAGEDGRNDAHNGGYGAFVTNQGVPGGVHPTYRPIPLKPDATYDWSVWFKNYERVGDNGWRDFNGWFNSVDNGGSRQVYEHREDIDVWGLRSGNFKSNADRERFIIDIPCVNNGEDYNTSAYDEISLRERVPEAKFEAIIPDNIVNLIPNGDFEDEEANKQYATCFEDPCPEWSEMWGARVRLQTGRQPGNDEAGPNFARSGNNSLRYFNCFGNDVEFGGDFFMQEDGRGKNSNLNFQQELEAGRTYTFGFWYHFAQWGGDHFTLQVKNGEEILWSKVINNADFPDWINKVFTFTTTGFNHTLKLQTVRDGGTPGLIYFDDFVLFEGTPVSVTNPEPVSSFLFFGKATGVESTEVEIQKVSYSTSGAYAPDGSPLSQAYVEISTPEQFNNIRNDLEGYYRLTADIDLSGYENFEPIGKDGLPFRGELLGDFHVISGLTISREAGYQALFGYATNAIFANLIIKDASVQGTGQNVGILFGRGTGITVDQVAIIESTVWGFDHVGALGGITESGGKISWIKNVYVEGGSVNTTEHQAGGILGIAKSTLLENSYFTGYVVSADIAGRDAGGIISRTEDGEVELKGVISLASEVTGGRTGQFIPFGPALKSFADCFARDDMNVGPGVDPNDPGRRASDDQLLPLSEFKTQALYTDIGWDFDTVWKFEAGKPFPVFKNTTTAIKTPGTATEQNLKVLKGASNTLLLRVNSPATVSIYNTTGMLINRLEVQKTANIALPHGIYIVKSVSNRITETVKFVN